jgi:hypothetical protein
MGMTIVFHPALISFVSISSFHLLAHYFNQPINDMAFKLTIDKSIYISDIALMIFQIDLIV